ncbi:3-oxoacyl-ACP synthase [Pelotalea chapellei]|uniref:3-oxoacyl-ACP synthase n=1 Tax=Pelotalea chapellei TaxID=44671 RepID=A0ABS5UAS6_9BACT|nr:3-oxoacyl-ACP synthase [Pelotalea chapellei]MBT1072770.1 3-oxoacyl-ACP synthase [Pelotalea chapellei]
MKTLAMTAVNSITAVGHDGRMTAASVRAGISRLSEYDDYLDSDGNPITVARIRDIEDDNHDTASRLSSIASKCLEEMLGDYFKDCTSRPSTFHLILGVASEDRPGPRYEESCLYPLKMVMDEWADKVELEVVPQGNASMPYALAQAAELIESNPATLCIIGGIDSLLRASTLNWFEQAGRLKSVSYGRHQGLIAGEAVGFMIIEDPARAEQASRPILARITALGLAEESSPRASNSPSRNSGLTDACHAALSGVQDKEIRAMFGDLNGENSRAVEWSMADMRCFKERYEQRQLWTPANCYGDIGAASGTVIANIVTQGFTRGWLQSPALMFCSDDHGSCGALVLEKG